MLGMMQLGSSYSWGEVVVDGTLGTPAVDLTGPKYRITDDLGAIRGTNLFHSFQEFSLMADESAIFSGPASIENILARVTGGIKSEIDGLIKSEIMGANLYFMNPSGVIFGPNAQVDVSGSFTVTNADHIKLGDAGSFNALNPQDSVLTSAPPSAFGFLTNDPSRIAITNNMLEVRENASLSIIGGDTAYEAAELSVDGSRLNVVSLGGPGEVANSGGEVKSPQTNGFLEFLGDITVFRDKDVIATEGGTITIKGHNLNLEGASFTSTTTGDIDGGNINIRLTGDLAITEGSVIATFTEGNGNGGAIMINADQIILESQSFLSSKIESKTTGTGTGGEIHICARNQVLLMGDFFSSAEIRSDTDSNQGKGGNILIEAGTLHGSGNIKIVSNSEPQGGMGGNITIFAFRQILLEGVDDVENFILESAQIQSRVASDSPGVKGGNISVTAPEVNLVTAAIIRTETIGQGIGGDISIHTVDENLAEIPRTIILDETASTLGRVRISASTSGSGSLPGGPGGNISVHTRNLEILNGAEIKADTLENGGDGGNIDIVALEKLRLDGKNGLAIPLVAAQSKSNSGAAGRVFIKSKHLELLKGGQILANSTGASNAGSIKLVIDEHLLMDNGDVSSDSFTTIGASQQANQGTSGDIFIEAPGTLEIVNGAQINSNAVFGSEGGNITLDVGKLVVIDSKITASTRGEDAGTISITADEIRLSREHDIDSGLAVRTEMGSTGDGGRLLINTGTLDLNNGAEITSESRGSGDAGPIDIVARHRISIDNSGIVAEAINRNGGNISIHSSGGIDVRRSGTITAKAGSDGGNIRLQAARGITLFNGEIAGNAGKNGGNITVGAEVILLSSSHIDARAIDEDGGNIELMTKGFLASFDSTIDASSEFGVSGSIEVLAPDIDVAGSLAILPESFFSSEVQLQDSCAIRLSGDFSSFIAVGRGGIPYEPGGIIPDISTWKR